MPGDSWARAVAASPRLLAGNRLDTVGKTGEHMVIVHGKKIGNGKKSKGTVMTSHTSRTLRWPIGIDEPSVTSDVYFGIMRTIKWYNLGVSADRRAVSKCDDRTFALIRAVAGLMPDQNVNIHTRYGTALLYSVRRGTT